MPWSVWEWYVFGQPTKQIETPHPNPTGDRSDAQMLNSCGNYGRREVLDAIGAKRAYMFFKLLVRTNSKKLKMLKRRVDQFLVI